MNKRNFVSAIIGTIICLAYYWVQTSRHPADVVPRSDSSGIQKELRDSSPSPEIPASQSGGANPILSQPGPTNPGAPRTVNAIPVLSTPSSVASPRSVISTPPPAASVIPPTAQLEHLHATLRNYGLRFGGNPVGTNAEITKALTGDNPGHVKFLDSNDPLSANGELLDPWGTPYFFHQLSGMDMEIHSAGPDKVMWTSDDITNQ